MTEMTRGLRLDLLIAVCALLLSAVAAAAAVFQTRAIENQLSATVWPYLSFTETDSNTGVQYSLGNDGLGPAILRSAAVTIDAAPKESFRQVGELLMPHRPKRAVVSSASLSIGEVIRAGQSVRFFEFSGSSFARTLQTQIRRRVVVRLCYCSLLGQCWTLDSLVSSRGPVQTASCPENSQIGA